MKIIEPPWCSNSAMQEVSFSTSKRWISAGIPLSQKHSPIPDLIPGSGDNILTITVHTPDETLTVTGIADLTADHFVFTRTSGTDEDFIDILEADKI